MGHEQREGSDLPDEIELFQSYDEDQAVAYERSKPPQIFLKPVENFHCSPDHTGYKGKRIDAYFEEVIDLLNYNDRAREVFINREYMTPHFERSGDPKIYPTDDSIGYLRAQDKLIAFYLETRTVFNHIDVTMVCTLTPELLAQLQKNEGLLKKSEPTQILMK